jgi:CRP/FNR family transcriptional regulator, cyclic AMP receptor protein
MISTEQALTRIPLLNSLSPEEHSILTSGATVQEARDGQMLAKTDEKVTRISFIVEGGAKVCRATSEGKEVTIALLGAGAHIGVVSYFSKAKRTTDVIATCRSILLHFDVKALDKHLRLFPALTYRLLISLSQRLNQTAAHLAEDGLFDLNQRLALRLFEMAELVEWENGQKLLVRQRPSHQELANLLGVTREAVTRALKFLDTTGHIEIIDNQVLVNSTPVEG